MRSLAAWGGLAITAALLVAAAVLSGEGQSTVFTPAISAVSSVLRGAAFGWSHMIERHHRRKAKPYTSPSGLFIQVSISRAALCEHGKQPTSRLAASHLFGNLLNYLCTRPSPSKSTMPPPGNLLLEKPVLGADPRPTGLLDLLLTHIQPRLTGGVPPPFQHTCFWCQSCMDGARFFSFSNSVKSLGCACRVQIAPQQTGFAHNHPLAPSTQRP